MASKRTHLVAVKRGGQFDRIFHFYQFFYSKRLLPFYILLPFLHTSVGLFRKLLAFDIGGYDNT